MVSITRVVAILFLFFTLKAYSADMVNTKRYALGDKGYISLTVPLGWIDEVRQPRPQLPPTIVFHPSGGGSFKILITPFWPMRDDVPKLTPKSIRENLSYSIEQAKVQSIETEVSLKNIEGPEVFGSYFSVTDRAPKPGEYKYMTQGLLSLADLYVNFTLLRTEEEEEVMAGALEMLRNAKYEK